uniref:Uncharacterized protein n=1 Tax=Anabas testudineus TaxID=64144 RepID=A0A3Q1HBI0_ANATE
MNVFVFVHIWVYSDEGEDYESLLPSDPGASTTAAPPPNTKQKRGHSPQGTSAPASKKPKQRLLTSTAREEEDRWHDREEEDIKPDPPRFMPARTPGPTFDTTKAQSPISLFQLFFSASVVKKIIKNTMPTLLKESKLGWSTQKKMKKKNSAEPLYTEMVKACKAHFQPYPNLFIGERMVITRGSVSTKQYIKDKPTKWGYKLFVLADSSSGYTWNFFVYSGQSRSPTGNSLSYSAAMDLLPFPLLGSGYRLFTDSFYTSPTLFTDLSEKTIGCCGIIRRNRTGFPQTKTNVLPQKAEKGDIRWIRTGKLLFVNWMDTRQVTMWSTVHQTYSGQTVRRKVREAGVWKNKLIPVPDCIVDYNKNMGDVDLSHALCGSYSIRHKTTKWYKTLFYHFVDIAVTNSYFLHKELFKFNQGPTQKKPLTHKTFREQLVKELLEFAEGSAATPPPPPPPPNTTCMPATFDSEEGRARKHCKRCHDAGAPRVKTAVYCRECRVPLCLSSKKNCFQLWHDGK